MIRKLSALLLGGILLLVGLVATSTAHATTTDVTVTAIVKNHADNGVSQHHWADDTFLRTMKLHDNGDGTFTTTVTDKGTFTTRKGAGSPNFGVSIKRAVMGSMTSTGSGTITGTLDPNWQDKDGVTYDDKLAGAKYPGSAEWAMGFFHTGATGDPFATTYEFVYKTIDETWDEKAAWDSEGNPNAGDITGKLSSKLLIGPCAAKNTQTWKVANARGDRSRTFTWWTYYKGVKSAAHTSTVPAATTVILHTAKSHTLGIHYYNGYGVSVWSWGHCA